MYEVHNPSFSNNSSIAERVPWEISNIFAGHQSNLYLRSDKGQPWLSSHSKFKQQKPQQ